MGWIRFTLVALARNPDFYCGNDPDFYLTDTTFWDKAVEELDEDDLARLADDFRTAQNDEWISRVPGWWGQVVSDIEDEYFPDDHRVDAEVEWIHTINKTGQDVYIDMSDDVEEELEERGIKLDEPAVEDMYTGGECEPSTEWYEALMKRLYEEYAAKAA